MDQYFVNLVIQCYTVFGNISAEKIPNGKTELFKSNIFEIFSQTMDILCLDTEDKRLYDILEWFSLNVTQKLPPQVVT